MKKIYILSLPILAMSLIACNNTNNVSKQSNIIVANEQYDDNPYFLATCKLNREDSSSRVYSMFKVDLNTDKIFTKSYLSSLISFNSYSEDNYFDDVIGLTLAVQFDGSNVTEYYVDFSKGDSSKIIKSTYSVFVVGNEVYKPYGNSINLDGYYSDSKYESQYDEWRNLKLNDNFVIDSSVILPKYFPNGAYLVKESYAAKNNYRTVSL